MPTPKKTPRKTSIIPLVVSAELHAALRELSRVSGVPQQRIMRSALANAIERFKREGRVH